MKGFIVILCIGCALATPTLNVENEWAEFKLQHSRKYSTRSEETKRQAIFAENLRTIAEHNEMFEKGLVTFEMGVNQFADMTPKEVSPGGTTMSFEEIKDSINDYVVPFVPPQDACVPDLKDWQAAGGTTESIDQTPCNACWSFASAAALEGALFAKTGKLRRISEKNFIDCAREDYYNHGCDNGTVAGAYYYVIKNGGIDDYESYPYDAKQGECKYDPKHNVTTVKSIAYIPPNDEETMKIAVAVSGPITVGIDSNPASFQLYKSGIYSEKNCTRVNHSITIVGYGTENGTDYWLVKNSWGPKWGNNGFGKILRNNNTCGIASQAPLFPILW